jgi:hypothetical protein
MKTYTFWYTEEVTYKAGFQADNPIDAMVMLRKIQSGEMFIDELPEFWNKGKDGNTLIGFETLEETE